MGSDHPLKTYRESQDPKLTLEALGRDVDASKFTLSRIEHWKQQPSYGLLCRLMARTGLAPDCFFRPAHRERAAAVREQAKARA